MATILLHCDEKFFIKMKRHKLDLELKLEKKINWDNYIRILFGMAVK